MKSGKLLTLAALGFALPVSDILARPSNEQKMNVLFIAVDDLKPTLGAYGDPYALSPNIDGLAGRGLAFQNAYVQQAVCGPSRASLMTGLRPDTTGVVKLEYQLRDKMPQVLTLPQHFKNNGYHTESAGKIYHHYEEDKPGWSQAEWHANRQFPGYGDPQNQAWHKLASQKYIKDRKEIGNKAAKQLKKNGPAFEAYDGADEVYPDYKIASRAIERLVELKKQDQPFFLAVGFVKPHLPFAAPKKYWDRFDPDKLPVASTHSLPEGAPQLAGQPGWELKSGYTGFEDFSSPVSPQMARKLVHGYYACVSFVDAQIGRVLRALEEQGLRENTIVVLYGDHGWHLGDHGLWGKHTNFEQATRAPLIVADPRAKANGSTSAAVVEFVDIFPTLAQLAGLEIPGVVNSVHWKSPISHADPKVRQACTDSMKTALQDCKDYGGTTVLLVAGVVNDTISYEDAYRRSIDEIRKMIPWAYETGVKIAIENVWNNFLISPMEAARFIDEINDPMVGWYFDIGNILRYGWPEHWIRTLNRRIMKLDAKEYSRKKQSDEGMWKGFDVELLEGDNNWPVVMRALEDINYQGGWMSAEVPGGDRKRLAEISERMDRIIAS